MSLNLEDFKARLAGGGSRANLFKVLLTGPGINTEEASFLCRAAQMPASVISNVEVPFRGRILKLSGDRTFEDWTVTIYNDVNMNVRKAMEQWSALMQNHITSGGNANIQAYKATLIVQHLNKEGATTHQYVFVGAFPSNIAAIDLSYDQVSSIEEFQVTFTYDYWVTTEVGAVESSGATQSVDSSTNNGIGGALGSVASTLSAASSVAQAGQRLAGAVSNLFGR